MSQNVVIAQRTFVQKTIMALFSFFRLPNLLIIFMTLTGASRILFAAFGKSASSQNYVLLTLATLLVTVGGNLINDYYDQKIDAINKPQKLVVGKLFSPQWAIVFYAVINGIAMVLAFILARNLGFPLWSVLLYPAVIAGLWLYSYRLKCLPLIGNLVVALFCVLVPLQLWWLLKTEHHLIASVMPERLVFYLTFAFLLTLWREIVKDLEDMKGDSIGGCNTLPIRIGERNARFLSLGLGAVSFAFLGLSIYRHVDSEMQIWYLPFLLVPCGVAINFLTKSGHPIFYHKASTVIKILMAVGVVMLAL